MTVSVDVLQSTVSQIQNSVTRAAAQQLLNIAAASGNPSALDSVGAMLTLSAKGSGTAIFYSGVGPNGLENLQNAQNVQASVLGGNGYLWMDTPLGAYIDTSATPSLESLGYLPPGFASAAVNYVSAKMAQEAVGPAVACVNGTYNPGEYYAWLAQELPAAYEEATLRAQGGSSVPQVSFNGVPVTFLVQGDVGLPPIVSTKLISSIYDCTSGEPVPSLATVLATMPSLEPGLESPWIPSLLLGLAVSAAGLTYAGGRLIAQGAAWLSESLSVGGATSALGLGSIGLGSGAQAGVPFSNVLDLDYQMATAFGAGAVQVPLYNYYTDLMSSYLVNPSSTLTGSIGSVGFSDLPIGAFYESTSPANDPAPSIAASTPRLLNSLNQGLTEYGLSTYDTNFDGKLSGSELNNLRAWVDANENGVAEAGEIKTLAAAGLTEIKQFNYIYYAAGNAVAAPAVVTAASVSPATSTWPRSRSSTLQISRYRGRIQVSRSCRPRASAPPCQPRTRRRRRNRPRHQPRAATHSPQ